jgi:hypothetical protein
MEKVSIVRDEDMWWASERLGKRLPLLIALLYFATGDYISLGRQLRFFF